MGTRQRSWQRFSRVGGYRGCRGRAPARLAPARSRARWPPGLRQLSGGCLLLVPEQAEPDELLVFFHGAGGEAADGLALVEPLVPDRGLLVLLPNSRGGTWDLVQGRTGPDAEALDAGLGQVMAALDVRRVALAGFSDGGGLMPCHQAWPTGT